MAISHKFAPINFSTTPEALVFTFCADIRPASFTKFTHQRTPKVAQCRSRGQIRKFNDPSNFYTTPEDRAQKYRRDISCSSNTKFIYQFHGPLNGHINVT